MEKYVYILLYSFILVWSLLYTWHKLLNKKINYKDRKIYITLICLMIISVFNYFLMNKFIKITLITIVFMFFVKYLFKIDLHKCIITPIFSQLLIMIAEAIYALIIVMLNLDINSTLNSLFINMISNIIIALIVVIIVNIKQVRKLYNMILKITDKINNIQLSVFCVIAMLIANVLAMSSYYKIEFKYLLIFNISMTVVCFIIIFYSFRTQNKFNKVSDKYNIAIKSLNDYEDMMSKYRVNNHENKNLLLTVRAMIVNNQKEIPAYIDKIVEDKYNDDERLLFKMSVIPSGGLRATIYSEILKIKNYNINYFLDIDRQVKTIDLIELNTNAVIDVCKIIGVNNLDEKQINISLYVEKDTLNIKVSNNYKGEIEISKIFDEGYTTKGNGHGYGLPLVKNIIENNNIFESKTELSKDLFSQILSIKYKK